MLPRVHLCYIHLVTTVVVSMQVHAGEWPGTLHNIEYALARIAAGCPIRRIGHGLCLASSADMLEKVAAAGITVEVCLSANVGSTRAASFESHPIKQMLTGKVFHIRGCLFCQF
jgi:adenosine deaminase